MWSCKPSEFQDDERKIRRAAVPLLTRRCRQKSPSSWLMDCWYIHLPLPSSGLVYHGDPTVYRANLLQPLCLMHQTMLSMGSWFVTKATSFGWVSQQQLGGKAQISRDCCFLIFQHREFILKGHERSYRQTKMKSQQHWWAESLTWSCCSVNGGDVQQRLYHPSGLHLCFTSGELSSRDPSAPLFSSYALLPWNG